MRIPHGMDARVYVPRRRQPNQPPDRKGDIVLAGGNKATVALFHTTTIMRCSRIVPVNQRNIEVPYETHVVIGDEAIGLYWHVSSRIQRRYQMFVNHLAARERQRGWKRTAFWEAQRLGTVRADDKTKSRRRDGDSASESAGTTVAERSTRRQCTHTDNKLKIFSPRETLWR